MVGYMDRSEFKIIAARLRAVYPRDFMPDQAAFDTWYLLLADLPLSVAQAAALRYMQTGRFPPTPADIRSIAEEITAPAEEALSEQEVWQLVSQAICRSGYYAEQEYEQLPPIVRKAVGGASNLRKWAAADEQETQTVIQSQVLRSYRAELDRAKRNAMTSPDVRAAIERIRTEAIAAGGQQDGNGELRQQEEAKDEIAEKMA